MQLNYKIEHKKIFTLLTIIISLILGYDSSANGILSISRTIVFFPIFANGYFWGQKDYLNVRKKTFYKKAVSVFLFATLCIILYVFKDKLDILYFYGSMPYYDFYGPLMRCAIYVANAISINLFINIIPDKKLFFTFLGKNTFAVYILHYLILYLLYHCTIIVNFRHRTLLSFLLSINILLILSNRYVMLYLKKAFNFISEKTLKLYYYLCNQQN